MSISAQERDVRPYGHRQDDGVVQLSFTLPVAHSESASQAALDVLAQMNLEQGRIVASEAIGTGFTFFVAYAQVRPGISVKFKEAPPPVVVTPASAQSSDTSSTNSESGEAEKKGGLLARLFGGTS